jgi:hypothetical protein
LCVALCAASIPHHVAAAAGVSQSPSALAAAGAKASPELIGSLTKSLGTTPEQAAGAAGALFSLAKTRLKPDQFARVAQAVPGMDALLKAAPSADPASPIGTTMSKLPGGAAGLSALTSSFAKLGLKPDMVGQAAGVLTSFVTKSGGPQLGNLLAGVLK